ncbi:MAG TPA: hypothetical protein VK675_01090 [Candidatus Paceibacterota bacterium]|nr:hypothetical protein [Candidatus Paceibacterota bacterium]
MLVKIVSAPPGFDALEASIEMIVLIRKSVTAGPNGILNIHKGTDEDIGILSTHFGILLEKVPE